MGTLAPIPGYRILPVNNGIPMPYNAILPLHLWNYGPNTWGFEHTEGGGDRD